MNLKTTLGAWVARLDAMPPRDRYAMFAAALALLLGLEWLAVWPLQGQREAISQASSSEAQGQADARSAADGARLQQQADLDARGAVLDKALAAFGVAPSRGRGGASAGDALRGESLSFLLSRTLQRQAVRVVSLRALGVEEVAPVNAPTDAVAEAPAAAASAGSAAEAQAAPLFRHRYELKLGGELGALTQAVQSLEQGARPLRIERLRIAAADGDNLHATVTLVTIGMERSWLSL